MGTKKREGTALGRRRSKKRRLTLIINTHPKRRKDLWHKDTFLLEKRATYLTNKKKGGEIGDR
jgi:hypothetical protein